MTTRSSSTVLKAYGNAPAFGVWPVDYDGAIIQAERVFYTRPPVIPSDLQGVFNALRHAQTPVQLVTVRKAGMPERRDGKHLQHYLVPVETRLQVVGMTI